MIQIIINDAKTIEIIRSEEDAPKAYGYFVKDSNASVQENALLELEQLSNYNAELHQSCNFIMRKLGEG